VPTTGRQFAMLPPPLRVKQSWANLAVLCNGAEIRRLEPYCYGQFTEGKASPHAGRSHVHLYDGGDAPAPH